MPKIIINVDGSVSVVRTQEETINYYNKQIMQRIEAMVKLIALGADPAAIQTRIVQLNLEKKQKMLEVK